MQEQINISVIIPIYNGEAFIKKCLDALLVQKNIKNYEIIVIDDASTDNSLTLAKTWKNKDKRIRGLTSIIWRRCAEAFKHLRNCSQQF